VSGVGKSGHPIGRCHYVTHSCFFSKLVYFIGVKNILQKIPTKTAKDILWRQQPWKFCRKNPTHIDISSITAKTLANKRGERPPSSLELGKHHCPQGFLSQRPCLPCPAMHISVWYVDWGSSPWLLDPKLAGSCRCSREITQDLPSIDHLPCFMVAIFNRMPTPQQP
jgi:hypothetical protein